MTFLEAVFEKNFNKAEKNTNQRFDRLESQLKDIQATLTKHRRLTKKRMFSAKLQECLQKVETTASVHGESLKHFQSKLADWRTEAERTTYVSSTQKEAKKKEIR